MKTSAACRIHQVQVEKRETVCNICGSGESRLTATVQGCNYVRCSVCGVERMAEYPTESETREFYAKEYLTKKFNDLGHHIELTPENRSAYFAEKDLTFGDLNMDLKKYSGKSLLDVGCATASSLNMPEDSE